MAFRGVQPLGAPRRDARHISSPSRFSCWPKTWSTATGAAPLHQALAERGPCGPARPSRADLSTLLRGARLVESHNDPEQAPTGGDWPQDAPLFDPVEPQRRVQAAVELRFADPALLARLCEGERWSTHRWPWRA